MWPEAFAFCLCIFLLIAVWSLDNYVQWKVSWSWSWKRSLRTTLLVLHYVLWFCVFALLGIMFELSKGVT